MDLKKFAAGFVAALTLGIGAFAVASPSVGATTTKTVATAPSSAATAAKGKGAHPKIRAILRRKAGKLAAKTIGIPPKELRTDLKNGQSIAEVAQAHNVDPQKVVQALVDGGNKAIDKYAAKGKLTPEQATNLKNKLPDAAAKVVNAKRHTK